MADALDTRCPCCGTRFALRHRVSGNIGVIPENAINRDTLIEFLQSIAVCPKCGYAGTNFDRDISAAERDAVQSANYQALFRNKTLPDTDKRLGLFILLAEKCHDYENTGHAYQIRYWYKRAMAFNCHYELEKAYYNYLSAIEENPNDETALVVVDLMRQAGSFSEAEDEVRSLLRYAMRGSPLLNSLSRERELIAERDTSPFTPSGSEEPSCVAVVCDDDENSDDSGDDASVLPAEALKPKPIPYLPKEYKSRPTTASCVTELSVSVKSDDIVDKIRDDYGSCDFDDNSDEEDFEDFDNFDKF